MKLSATSIRRFKACPMLFYNADILGLRRVVDADVFRVGTNYHRVQEISSMVPGGVCECTTIEGPAIDCELCEGSGDFPEDPMDAVVRHLNKAYAAVPPDKTPEEWEVERIIILYSLAGYQWWYSEDGYTVERLESHFDLPLLSPKTGRRLQCRVVGKIDRVFTDEYGRRYIHEYKSTSSSLDPDSDYWGHLRLDTQTLLYSYAAEREGYQAAGMLYDVWRKPAIRPKKLTQSDSKAFISDGSYCGEEFVIAGRVESGLQVGGNPAEVTPGAKDGTFAIRETPEMFGARLLREYTNSPERYFARKELVRTESDIAAFEHELYFIYKTIRSMKNTGHWFKNESQCESHGKCDFISSCYSHRTITPDEVPDGFRKVGA